jgi:hypothetical protein
MARLRFFIMAALVLAMTGCQLLKQQENFISFTLDGLQYLYTASDDDSGHPYAIGYESSGEVVQYRILGSATAAEAVAGDSTLVITLTHVRTSWGLTMTMYDGDGNPYSFTLPPLPSVHEDEIDSFIMNRNAVGEQVAGSIPGPFSDGQMTHTLENIVFSVERLPDEPYVMPQ